VIIRYLLAMVAGIWMADGLALLVAPRHVNALLREVVDVSPKVWGWEALAACLGALLLFGTRGLRYEVIWTVTGLAMIGKGVFLTIAPEAWRRRVLDWCLGREEIDYRFWGLGLCAMALLLLKSAGWIGAGTP